MTSSTTAAQKRASAKPQIQTRAIDPCFLETRVVENNLHADTAEGELVIPLTLKTRVFRQMRDSGKDGLDQIEEFVLKPLPAGKKLIEALEELDISVSMGVVEAYFAAVTERNGASLGE